MTTDPADARGRDRAATERRILAAAKRVLAAAGFQGFGVNAVAREAGCDKQLIYRYFGGQGGLTEAVGRDLADWWGERLAPIEALDGPETYADLVERMALGLLQALRDDPLMQKIAAWEAVESTPEVRRLAEARSRSLSAWMRRVRGDLSAPPGVDAPAVNALLIAAIHHLVLLSAGAGAFAGLDLATEEQWERVRRALRALIRSAYG